MLEKILRNVSKFTPSEVIFTPIECTVDAYAKRFNVWARDNEIVFVELSVREYWIYMYK